jgi:hypothetical protein
LVDFLLGKGTLWLYQQVSFSPWDPGKSSFVDLTAGELQSALPGDGVAKEFAQTSYRNRIGWILKHSHRDRSGHL